MFTTPVAECNSGECTAAYR